MNPDTNTASDVPEVAGLDSDELERLVARFENWDFEKSHDIPVPYYLLRVAVRRGATGSDLDETVTAALTAGTPWTRIAQVLGVSVATARRRHGAD